jgi:hypothetical protein
LCEREKVRDACKSYINSITKTPILTSDTPLFFIEWLNSTTKGKKGDKLSHYRPTTHPNVVTQHFLQKNTTNRSSSLFLIPTHLRRPSSSISIDTEGYLELFFGACPHPERRIWAAAEMAGGAFQHFLKNRQQKQSKQLDSHLLFTPVGPPR